MRKSLIIIGTTILFTAILTGGAVMALSPHSPVKLSLAQLQALQYTAPQITTTLGDGGTIQTTLVLQTTNQQTLAALNASQAQVVDAIIRTLNNTSGALIDIPGGTAVLAERIRRAMLPFGDITHVYFTQLIVQ